MQSSRPILIALVAVVGVIVLWQTSRTFYFQPKAELLDELAKAQESVREREENLRFQPSTQRMLREIESRTLGGDLETADHHLRSRLNRLREQVGIPDEGATVGTGSPSARQSPAARLFGTRDPLQRQMREMIDFVELPASISCQGTLLQLVELIDRIEAEPWIKRITSLKIDPRRSGETFTLTLRLTTLFLPGSPASPAPTHHRQPGTETISTASAYERDRLDRYASLISVNPFRVPAPRPAPQPVAQAKPSGFPYAQWILTGVAEGGSGPEVWLRNSSSGGTTLLRIGEKLGEAEFVGASSGDQAEFRIGELHFLITIGGHLAHSLPVNQ